METDMPVREIMTRQVITADLETSIPEVAKKMIEYDVGSAIVTNNRKPIGIITEQDMTRKIISENLKPSSLLLKKVMSRPLITIGPDESIGKATKKMLEMHVRRLPVVDSDGKLIGIVTDADLISVSSKMNDILADLIKVNKEDKGYFIELNQTLSQGICEVCGEYTENLEFINGESVCESCKDSYI
ncbi:MAG: CBS domain-containing protein, partial [Methanosarcinales archaeon]